METLSEIYNHIYSSEYPIDVRKLASACPHLGDDEITSAIALLEKSGLVLKKKNENYAINSKSGKLLGVLEVKSKGYGYVILQERDCFVAKRDLGSAMNGDLVVVKVRSRGKRARTLEGTIVKILKRANRKIIGRFQYEGRIAVVSPSDKRIPFDIEIPKKSRAAAHEGQIVVAEISKYPDEKGSLPVGEIVEILGNEWDPLIQVEIIIREHNLCVDFPQDVEQECSSFGEPTGKDLDGRKDYRKMLTVTIDGVDAKDFDDAVAVTRTKDGYKLSVLIADVTHYVFPGRFTYEEAENRATSVYLVDRVIPMLPKALSNNICSLVPNRERLCLAVEIYVTNKGEVSSFDIHKGIMFSDFRLTYEDVDKFFDSGKSSWPKEVEKMLTELKELSLILEKKRLKRGSIDFESVEPKVILDEEGKPTEIKLVSETASRKLIEESMILANEVIAGFLKKRQNGAVYRIHQEPDVEVIAQLSATIESLGHPRLPDMPTPFDLQKVVEFAHNKPEKLLINTLLLRSMQQARYSTLEIGHYGLASEDYTHFTSPIRRFPDLLVHLLVKNEMFKKFDKDAAVRFIQHLPMMAEHSSIREREAQAAERASVNVKICEYMTRHIGEEFDAIISGVSSFGIFVELDNTAEGLIHISKLTGDYFKFNKDDLSMEGIKTGARYRLGQQVRVLLKRVKVGERQLDFELI